MSLNLKAIVVIALVIILLATFSVVAYVEGGKERAGAALVAVASKEAQQCIDCHSGNDKTPNVVTAWRSSSHAAKAVDCLSCHKVKKGEWDYFECPGSTTAIASHPTPNDCKECHEQQVVEFARSKHAATSMIKFAGSFDRTVFEPTLATKHGCQQCHEIGHVWPDQSVGECDACHAKHTFSVAIARNPYSCGECHIGPDHPHIEIWLESKHGNVFTSFADSQKQLGYKAKDYENKPAPVKAPTCSTCHMDAGPGLKATHDVGERLGWETQSPWSFRTTEAWGGGITWQAKRSNMERACGQCHTPSFYQRYLLTADLNILLYDEIFREGRRWLTEMNKAGIILTPGVKDGLAAFGVAGYDEEPEEEIYYLWHHDGRRFRHGAIMMGADYTQWHGIWDLQNILVRIIRYGADKGLPEAVAWMKSDDPAKYWLYPILDVPGSAWGIDTLAYRKSPEHTTPILYNRAGAMPDYWDRAKANAEAAWKNGLLSDKQWEMWQKLYADRDREEGQTFPLPDDIRIHKEGDKRDATSTDSQIIQFKFPFGGAWKYKP